jgi:hypothetical protein
VWAAQSSDERDQVARQIGHDLEDNEAVHSRVQEQRDPVGIRHQPRP